MLLSLNWLKDFITLELPVSELAHKLTMSGTEVDEIIEVGPEWDNVVTGEITDIAPHPNADKLRLTKVTTGEQTYSVVCGAPNIEVGQKIALACVGAELPGGLKIKKSKIRGELSEGMICSEIELEIGNDASGIMVLPPDTQIGLPIAQALQLNDTVLSLGVTPNRSDCFSVVGLAREISAVLDVPLQHSETTCTESGKSIDDVISVTIHDPDLCPRYTARFIDDITIAPSPLWMRRRLENSGIRSINNVVDITNYILLEWGQPLHAFDYRLIQDKAINVRRALHGETFVTLDDIERRPDTDVVMICDGKRAVALGGIMGGENSGISDTTTSVLLESAYFNPRSIGRSSNILKLKTESSERFKKGIDINGVIPALNRAASLVQQLAGGSIAEGIIDVYPSPLPSPDPIQISVEKTNKTIGISLSQNSIKDILGRLSITSEEIDADTIKAVPPTHRYDINAPIDLIEEVARINGYDAVPATNPYAKLTEIPVHTPFSLSNRLRDILTSCGLNEVVNYSFYAPDMIEALKLPESDDRAKPIHILNPLSASQSVMRTSIVPSLLANVRENIHNNCTNVKIFEISNTFLPNPEDKLPRETRRITGIITGLRFGELWNVEKQQADFYDVKGVVESLLHSLNITHYTCTCDSRELYLHPKNMLSLFIENTCIGCLGEVHPDVLEAFDIEQSAFVFDLDFELLSHYYVETPEYKPFSRQPAIYRDLALVVDDSVSSDTIYETIKKYKNKLLTEFHIFDSYQGKNIPAGKKSLAYRLKFQSDERTLTDNEVNKIHDKLLAFLGKEIGAELRN